MLVNFTSSLVPYKNEGPSSSLVLSLINSGDDRLYFEKQLQLALNRGLTISQEELETLQKHGYSISYNQETIDRFRNYQFPEDIELQNAVRSATSAKGLLIDKLKMYRPGPKSILEGAAKGYDEIRVIYKNQTSEKESIAKEVRNFIQLLESDLPKNHSWIGSKTIIDIACRNGDQLALLCKDTDWKMIGIDDQKGRIEQSKAHLPGHTFATHDIFERAPDSLKHQADIIFASNINCSSNSSIRLVKRLVEYRASTDSLLIFVNPCEGSDKDYLADKLSFLQSEPSYRMSEDFENALKADGYTLASYKKQAQVFFPTITSKIRDLILSIRRGDFENPYWRIDPEFKIVKALMEFIAGYPLEAMSQEELRSYLHELERLFENNGSSHLKICYKMIFAHASNADIPFIKSFKKAHETDDIDAALSKIREKMTGKHLYEAKSDLGKLLEPLWRKDHKKTLDGLELMSDLCLKHREYPEAAAILWYAKKYSKGNQNYDGKLNTIERELLTRQSIVHSGPFRGCEQSLEDRKRLQLIRERISTKYDEIRNLNHTEKVKELRILFQSISQEITSFIHTLTQDIITQLKGWAYILPCEFALVGLGSLAREEITPYSAVKFAILIDSDEPAAKDYFRILSTLLCLRFINLGETPLDGLDIFDLNFIYDTQTPKGLSFDEMTFKAFKNLNLLGKQEGSPGNFELIQNSLNIRQLLLRSTSDLPTIFSSITYVTGSNQGKKLISEFQLMIGKILGPEERVKKARQLINSDLLRFKANIGEEGYGEAYHVKIELYHLPNRIFDGLADYFCLKSSNTWDRIEELVEKEIISKEGAQDLKEFTMLAHELRLATFLIHQKQTDLLDIEKDDEIIFELYARFLPFINAIEAFCKADNIENAVACIQGKRFNSKLTYYHKGVIYFRHLHFREAEACLEIEPLNIPEYQLTLASLKNALGKYSEAEAIYLALIEKEATADLYLKLGEVRQSLAQYKKAEESFYRAEELYKAENDQKGLEKLYRILVLFYKRYNDDKKINEYFRKAKIINKERLSGIQKDHEYQVILDLEQAQILELEAQLCANSVIKHEKCLKCIHKVQQIYRGYYQMRDHPKLFACHSLIASQKQSLGLNEEAFEVQTKALEMQRKVLGKNHPQVASSYNNVGCTLENLDRNQEALENFTQSFEIQKILFDENHPVIASTLNNIGGVLRKLDRNEEAFMMQSKGLEIGKRLLGKKHPVVAAAYDHIGITLCNLKRLNEAHKKQLKALAIFETLFGKKHLDVIRVSNYIASTVSDLGREKEALKIETEDLKIRQELLAQNNQDIAFSYHNKGFYFANFGQHEEALLEFMKSLGMLKNIFGEYHTNVALSYFFIGKSLGFLGRNKEAIEMFNKSLEILRKNFGKNSLEVAEYYVKIGLSLNELDCHDEALKKFKQSLGILKKHFGENHLEVSRIYQHIGLTLKKLNRQEEALEIYIKGLEIGKMHYGENYLGVADSYLNIAVDLQNLGRYEEAIEMYAKSLEIKKSIFGESNIYISQCYIYLGCALRDHGQCEEALVMLNKGLEIEKRIHGENHQRIANCYNQIGLSFILLKRYEEAQEIFSLVLKIIINHLGENQPSVLNIYSNMSYTLFKLGQYEKALEMLNKVLNYQNDDNIIAKSYDYKGRCLQKLGKHEEALQMFNKSLEIKKNILKIKNESLSKIYHKKAFVLRKLGRNEEALELTNEVLEFQIDRFGKNHPYVSKCYDNIGDTLKKLGRYTEALKIYKKALKIKEVVFAFEHQKTAKLYQKIGCVLKKLRKYEKALEIFKKALKIQTSLLGENSLKVAKIYHYMGLVLKKLGQKKEALEMRNKSLQIETSLLGEK